MSKTEYPLAAELAELAARMSPMLLSEDTVIATVERLTFIAREAVGEATGAGVSLVSSEGDRTSKAATSTVVLEADDWQYQLGEGPCLTSWGERRTVRVDDINDDPRWPQWSRAVQPLGLMSSLSAPLVAADRVLGAVKVYSEQRAAFDDRSQRLLEGVASTAALLLANVATPENGLELSDGLRRALKARDRVQLAKGVLIQRHGLTEDEAFQHLVADARNGGRDLHEAADQVIATATARYA